MSENVTFQKIVGEGKALGYLNGLACFAMGPLPGETAEVTPIKVKTKFMEAAVTKIVAASEHRQAAQEGHFLACSPWQGVDYDYQLELKRGLLEEAFGRPELGLAVLELVPAPQPLGYRNKLEFVLAAGADRQLSLVFHARGSADKLVPASEGCLLGSPTMNDAAQKLLARINELNVSGYVESLTIREARGGQVVAVLGLHQVAKRDWSSLAIPECAGVVVTRVRAGHRHEVVWHNGRWTLEETVLGTPLAYSATGFFQTNMPVFERALEQIMAAVPEEARVADLYGGVGAIGLAVARRARKVLSVEIDPAAVELANQNAERAGLANYDAVAVAAERLDPKLLVGVDTVIVDPPRAGLDRRLVETLLEAAPARIIYLSCNPVTQARDIMLLKTAYKTAGVTGFDFYPSTVHLESLVVLERTA